MVHRDFLKAMSQLLFLGDQLASFFHLPHRITGWAALSPSQPLCCLRRVVNDKFTTPFICMNCSLRTIYSYRIVCHLLVDCVLLLLKHLMQDDPTDSFFIASEYKVISEPKCRSFLVPSLQCILYKLLRVKEMLHVEHTVNSWTHMQCCRTHRWLMWASLTRSEKQRRHCHLF